jgi:hypothetical protein
VLTAVPTDTPTVEHSTGGRRRSVSWMPAAVIAAAILGVLVQHWLRPTPPQRTTAQVIVPKPNALVHDFSIVVHFQNVPRMQTLWFASQGFGSRRIHPDIAPLVLSTAKLYKRGTVSETVWVGVTGKAPKRVSRDKYELLIMSLSPSQADKLREYNTDKRYGRYPGTSLPRGADVIDQSYVERIPGQR